MLRAQRRIMRAALNATERRRNEARIVFYHLSVAKAAVVKASSWTPTEHIDILLEEYGRACTLLDQDYTHEAQIVFALERCAEEARFP